MLSTTALFVEIVIIGIGGFGAVLLIFFACTPFYPPPEAWRFFPFMVAPALALDYILGNIIDRLADRLMGFSDDKYKDKHFKSFTYAEARTWVYIWSKPARATFEYGKSRIRICRGWILNAPILAIAFDIFVDSPKVPLQLKTSLGVFFPSTLLLIFVFSWISWHILSRDHFSRLSWYYKEMKKYRSKYSIEVDQVGIRTEGASHTGDRAIGYKEAGDEESQNPALQRDANAVLAICAAGIAHILITLLNRVRGRP